MHITRPVALMLGACVAFAACKEPPSPPPPARPTPALTAAPFDVSAVMRQVHFAWRADERGAWRAAHSTWAARVEAGALEVTPYHAPDGRLVEGQPVRFGPPVLSRGATTLDATTRRAANGPKGGLEIDRLGFTEHYAGTDDGVEVSWRFGQKPEGSGPLTVRLPTTATFLARTPRGLHFAAGSLGLRVGQGTWVDATGRRTPIPVGFERGHVVLRVPGDLLESTTFPAVLDPVFGPERELDQPVSVPAPGSQGGADVAAGASDFLVVWNDTRRGTSTDADVYAARVTPTGDVLDPAGVVISEAPFDQRRPSVAWNGAAWLVAWQDQRNGAEDVFGARVTPGGVVRDPGGLALSSAPGSQVEPAVASNGQDFLVVWQDHRTNAVGDLYGARVTAGGSVLDPTGVQISASASGQASPDVAWDGAHYLVVWQDGAGTSPSAIRAARVAATGSVQDPNGLLLAATAAAQSAPAVASDGNRCLVVWSDVRTGGIDLYGTRVDRNGAELDTGGFVIANAPGPESRPAVAWNGATWLVAWETVATSAPGLKATRVSAAGVADASAVDLSASPNAGRVALAALGSTFLAVWQDWRVSGADDISGALVDAANAVAVRAPLLIGASANAQTGPSIATDGRDYLVVWVDDRAGDSDIYAARVSAVGTVLDATGIAVCEETGHQLGPAAAWTGASYIVVWQDVRDGLQSDIYGARISAQGVPQDSAPFLISNASGNQLQPAVASNGAGALVVWQDQRITAGADIYGTLVGQDGAVGDRAGTAITDASGAQVLPAVASNGIDYFVVWADSRTGASDIFGTRVLGANGAPQDQSGISINTNAGAQVRPGVAWDTAAWLTVWQDNLATGARIAAARVSGTGVVLNTTGFSISSAAGENLAPSVAFDGVNSVVTWLDARGTGMGVALARYSPGGTLVDASAVPVSTAADARNAVAIACTGSRRCLLGWDAWVGRPGINAARVVARTFADTEAPTATPQQVTTAEDTPLSIKLQGDDPEGEALRFFTTPPENGTLSGTAPDLVYTPAPDFTGTDSFAVIANDGLADSVPAVITIDVTPVNDAPVAVPQDFPVEPDTPATLTLTGTDIDGDTLTFEVTQPPAHGTLSGTPPTLTYTPQEGYIGPDAIAFVARDAELTSAPAAVSVIVGSARGAVVIRLGQDCASAPGGGGAWVWEGLALALLALRRGPASGQNRRASDRRSHSQQP